MSVGEKHSLIFPNKNMSVLRQCDLLGLMRSSYYYAAKEPKSDTELMNEIMDIWVKYPFYGYRRITDELIDRGSQLIEQIKSGPRISPTSRFLAAWFIYLPCLIGIAGMLWVGSSLIQWRRA